MKSTPVTIWRWLAFAQAWFGFLGSLFFSYVLHLPACTLCYYQRAIIGGLAMLLFASTIRPHNKLWLFALPFSIGGFFLAFYHHLLQIGVLQESATVCSLNDISCATKVLVGPFDIPFLSMLVFLGITIALILDARSGRHHPDQLR